MVVVRQEVCRFCLTTSKGFAETIKSLVEKSANLYNESWICKKEKQKGMRIYRLREFTNEEDFPIFVQYGYHNDDFVTHMHEDFSELVIILEGHAMHRVGEESFYIKKGDVFVINENTSHSFYDAKELRLCNIMFSMKKIFQGRYDITQCAGFHALFLLEPYHVQKEHFTSRLLLNEKEFLELKCHLDEMLEECQQDRQGKMTMLQVQFLYVATFLSRLYDSSQKEQSDKIMPLANTIVYMEQHFNENLSVESLAASAGYSARHFTRIFKETYHDTPSDYMMTLRIEKACYLLKKSKYQISEVARLCGYDNANYFWRIFKKRKGMSPSEYIACYRI